MYDRIATRLFNTPLAVTGNKLSTIVDAVGLRILTGNTIDLRMDSDEGDGLPTSKPMYSCPANEGVVEVFGTLFSKNGAGASGGSSYQSLEQKIRFLVENCDKTKLWFYFDSYGGEVTGCFAFANFINSLPKTYGIQTASFVDNACSAAYALASATQEIYVTPSANIGSIAVIATLANLVKRDEQQGIEYLILRSKAEKALLNAHENFSEVAVKNLIATIETLDGQFNDLVSGFRPSLSVDNIIELKGKDFLGSESLTLKLADEIVPSFDFVLSKSRSKANSNSNIPKQVMTMQTVEELKAALAAKDAEISAKSAEIATLKAAAADEVKKAAVEEKQRVLALIEAGTTLKVEGKMIVDMISQDRTLSDAKSLFEYAAELRGNSTQIPTHSFDSTVSRQFDSSKPDKGSNLAEAMKSDAFWDSLYKAEKPFSAIL